MKYGYKDLKENTKCKTCLGCNRLELIDFTGVYRCENYIGGMLDGYDSRRDTKNNETIL